MNEKQEKRAAAELPDELLDQAAGGSNASFAKICHRCGAGDEPIIGGYCPKCRRELGL